MFTKNIFVVLGLCTVLSAQNFDTLLKKALQTSPYLKANSLEIERADEQSSLIQRYKNPTLSLEVSAFTPDVGKREAGYRAGISQPIRLWGVSEDRQRVAQATKQEAKGLIKQKRAEFIKAFSLLYNSYITQTALVDLVKEEVAIAKKIVLISKQRYEAGTIAKVKYFRTKVDLIGSENLLDERKAMQIASYYKLLAFAGLKEEQEIDVKYSFRLSEKRFQEAQTDSAELHYLQSKQNTLSAKAQLNANKIEWMRLYTEYEVEPDQNIARVGVNIPLALFNTKKEEKKIAILEAKQSQFLLQNQKIMLANNLERLKKELSILRSLIQSTHKLYDSQKELLQMYEEGYKIANINLLELQNMKNQMIQTKEKEIILQNKINKNIVIYNYEVGEYNE